jgi:hypothetical protein
MIITVVTARSDSNKLNSARSPQDGGLSTGSHSRVNSAAGLRSPFRSPASGVRHEHFVVKSNVDWLDVKYWPQSLLEWRVVDPRRH